MSKNSVSRWCKNLKLSPVARSIIDKKVKHIQNKFRSYNQQRHRLVLKENKEIINKAIGQINTLSQRELLLVGTALYWGEGERQKFPSHQGRVHFANSDPNMVALFLRFIREIVQVPEERFRVSIRIPPNINGKIAINFWSKITKIPKNRFHVEYYLSKASQGKRPKNLLPYGTFHLFINSRQILFQIKGWIDGLIRQI